MKGAPQDVRRINKYLRNAGIESLVAEEIEADEKSGAVFSITLERLDAERVIPNGLRGHRRALLDKTATSDRHREILATKAVGQIRRVNIQRLMDALQRKPTGHD